MIFARAGFAEEKDVDVMIEDLLDRLEKRAHPRAPRANELAQRCHPERSEGSGVVERYDAPPAHTGPSLRSG